MSPFEAVLMWSGAAVLTGVALAALGAGIAVFGAMLHEAVNRWRIKGLTRAEVRYVRRVAARLRDRSKARDKPKGRRWHDTWEFHGS
ncbi:hypothetical protein ACOQFV_08925 [Nocardiopsis changdeensis]|uniref:Uncharacterized protein n=1 Tax=Nocardiopsis changdeensis TaxID=2831969 RepID=A0ABX8BE71_9ACTN|nr:MULTISPECIES: hypothetical protein [Nocardiopsis]QUX20334.1 hypothetical protein KGD84_17555 [Nocardiopsis changdeensis]QYX36264.1 hypothetical protein K1J57_27010 [Nocardiopsis sp. MT53]